MNIFACDESPWRAASFLPDRHIVKMPLECTQMLAVTFGRHGLDMGQLPKLDGTPYSDTAFRNHPCTVWARSSFANLAWLITHAKALCLEYMSRYNKVHGCGRAIIQADFLFRGTGKGLECYYAHQPFVRAMPEELKFDDSIDTITAYRRYLSTYKTWATWSEPASRPFWW